MKTIILVRHAKSGFKNTDMIDFDRPLSEKGNNEVIFMQKLLKKLDIKSDIIFCSDAKRTRETLEGLWEQLDCENEKIIYDKAIYDNHMDESLDYYLNLFTKIDMEKDVAIIVGHNPFITRLLRFFTKNENLGMDTLGFGIIDFKTENWKDVEAMRGELNFFINPTKKS
ncbi:MAG: phosphoglycerate mutase family protein [Candidatus Gracilibacteria bacterium]|nr:phosphoglycerate mutase family protein [Candidatus Gracilibacteria bacterium]